MPRLPAAVVLAVLAALLGGASTLGGASWLGTLGALAAPAVAHAEPPPADELRGRAKKALGKGMQDRLPEDDPRQATRRLPPPRELDDDYERRGRSSGEGSVIGSVLMWVLIGVIAVLIGMFLYNEFAGYERVAKDAGAGAELTDEATLAIVERPLGDAEALAAMGRYGEAIHVLLLRTFEELMHRLDRPVPPSRTSREILAETQLDADSHGALSHLVSAVEVSFFGGAAPGPDEYRLCVERFRRFATAYRGAGGARA